MAFLVNDSSKQHAAPFPFLNQVLVMASLRTFDAGELILSPEEQEKAFYYLINGSVEVSYTAQAGTQITVALIGAGEFFGEIGFFDGESRVRNIQAIGLVKIAIFNETVMAGLRSKHPELYMDFLLNLTGNICGKFRRIAGEREPIAGYAESLSTRHSSRYTESKPLPVALLNSSHWLLINSRMEYFKAELFNLSHTLQKAETQGEQDLESEQQCHRILEEINAALPDFAKHMQGSGYEEVMWGYIFKEIYPYLMRSRFAERAYFKPKGYAGDFLMMEHIYANSPQGEGKVGEIVDSFCLSRPGSKAIRGRRRLLSQQLTHITKQLTTSKQPLRIMNLACGPNRELFDFLAECPYSEKIEALCVDIDSEALQYTNQYVNIFPHLASIRLMRENVIKWALGRVQHHIPQQDIIYSMGLCDYLDPRLFRALIKRCFEHLRPGGVLLLGNFTFYPDSLFLDNLLKWELIYRTADNLRELFAPTPFGEEVQILSEEEQVNLFALATKS